MNTASVHTEESTATASDGFVVACRVDDVPANGGTRVLLQGKQIAIFHYTAIDKWFAVQNRCPHWDEEVLSRGLLGEADGTPYVACPLHKRRYTLDTGSCLTGDVGSIETYAIRIEGDNVLIRLAD